MKLNKFVKKIVSVLTKVLFSCHDKLDILTYSEAIKYFVNCKPADPRIAKGSIIIISIKSGKLTVWAFLDKDNNVVCNNKNIPYGRKILVNSFDPELDEAFGNNKLLIIE